MTAAPRFSANDYLTAFQSTMPRGPAWTREPGAVQTITLTGLSLGMARLDADANQLLIDAFPPTAVALLPEWEASLGLPDVAAGQAPSTAKRQRAVVAKFVGQQGGSAASFRSFAAAMGYDLTITPYAPFRVGQSAVGQAVGDDAWAFVLEIDTAPSAAPPFIDAVGAWDLAFVISGLRSMTPAHQTLLINPS
jgi:uncharacterized protein YmfQ (DUF2313 family)